jgi:hypothetical protein
MTEMLGNAHFSARMGHALHSVALFIKRAGFGLFLLAAGITAVVATTFIGLVLVVGAVFLSLAYGFGRSSRRGQSSHGDGQSSEPGTLEARRTADGWVIEPNGFSGR